MFSVRLFLTSMCDFFTQGGVTKSHTLIFGARGFQDTEYFLEDRMTRFFSIRLAIARETHSRRYPRNSAKYRSLQNITAPWVEKELIMANRSSSHP